MFIKVKYHNLLRIVKEVEWMEYSHMENTKRVFKNTFKGRTDNE